MLCCSGLMRRRLILNYPTLVLGPGPVHSRAALAQKVLSQGARRVVFNIVHVGPSSFGPDDDQAFQDALQPWQDRVLLSASLVSQQWEGLEQVQLRRPWDADFQVGLSAFSIDALGIVQAVPGTEQLEQMLAPFPRPHPHPMAHLAADVGTGQGITALTSWGPVVSCRWSLPGLSVDTRGIFGATKLS